MQPLRTNFFELPATGSLLNGHVLEVFINKQPGVPSTVAALISSEHLPFDVDSANAV